MTLAQSATRRTLQRVTRLTRAVLTLEAAAIAAVLALGAALRFVGLDWDHGHHQHPDERFLSMVLTQIQPAPDLRAYFDPGQSSLNPFNHDISFFVYGTFPLFLLESAVRALGRTGYDEAYLFGRALSALFDMGTVVLVYILGRQLLGPWPGVVAVALLAMTVHSIQIAHFFAVDTFATFFATLTLWLLVRYARSRDARSLGLAGIAAGLAMASKLSTGLLLALFAGWWALTVVREGVLTDTWARRGGVAGARGHVRRTRGADLSTVPALCVRRGLALGLAAGPGVHERTGATTSHPDGHAGLAAGHPVGGHDGLALSARTNRALGGRPGVRPGGARGAGSGDGRLVA